MAVTVLVELQIKEDKVDTLLQGIKETLPDMRAFDGFVAFEVVQNQEKPTNIILIQKWQTRAQHDNYLIRHFPDGAANTGWKTPPTPNTTIFKATSTSYRSFARSFSAEKGLEPVFRGMVTRQCSQESIFLSISNSVIDFTQRLGRHTGTGCTNCRIRVRMAANSFREIDTSAIWKRV